MQDEWYGTVNGIADLAVIDLHRILDASATRRAHNLCRNLHSSRSCSEGGTANNKVLAGGKGGS